jgi:glycerophosphoryl diester phosphodiesterase
VVSSFRPSTLEGVARLAPTWPRWLNSQTLDAVTIADALVLGCRGVAVQWRALDRGSVGRAQAAGLEVVSFTVRRRATFERLARLGLVAVCVEAAALDG